MRASLRSADAGWHGGAAQDGGRSDPRYGSRCAPRRLAGAADYTRGPPTPDVDPKVPGADSPPGAPANAASSSVDAEPELLGDDRRVGLDDERRTPRGGSARQAPAAAGTRSATIASHVAIARARRSSSSRPRPRAASGQQVADARSSAGAATRSRGPSSPAAGRGSAPAADEARAELGGPAIDLPGASPAATQARVEVVERRRRHERLGQLGDPPDEVRPPRRVELAEDVVEEEERRPAVELGQQVELGELEGEDRRPLLAARRRTPARSRPSSSKTRSSRCGPTSVVPFQTSFSAVSRAAGRARRAATRRASAGAFVS